MVMFTYPKIPLISLSAMDCCANYALLKDQKGETAYAIQELTKLHWTLLQWCKHLSTKKALYETRMTMKIIRMELSRLREKLTKDPS